MQRFTVAAFYQFCPLPDYERLRAAVQNICSKKHIKGLVLLASEGINGTIAGSNSAVSEAISEIHRLGTIFKFEPKISYTNEMPFLRLKVKLKSEIVPLGVDGLAPHVRMGKLVDPLDWNRLIEDEDVTIIDVRNDYEVRLGTFDRAIDPKTQTFREFPAFVAKSLDHSKHQKIAMFCTGGIRCEKASAFLLNNGFHEVYQLSGGILKYLEVMDPQKSKWKGDCFVFDKRVAVGHGVKTSDVELCYGCLSPLTSEDREKPEYEIGVACSYCASIQTDKQKASARERKHQIELARAQGKPHLGPQVDGAHPTSHTALRDD